MLDRKKRDLAETASNAISGYVAVVLAIVCFILVLAVTIALTRLFVGMSLASNPSKNIQGTSQVPVAQVGSANLSLT